MGDDLLPTITHLLIVDDDTRLRNLLERYLKRQKWIVTAAKHAKEARDFLRYCSVDLIVLDVMMPGETGLEFAKSLRNAQDTTPILMLTAMGEGHQRIDGLESGADDYLTKPFEPRELVLRIERILQRTKPLSLQTSAIHFGACELDIEQKRLLQQGKPLHLTESEMTLLCYLAEHINESVSRETLGQLLGSAEENINSRSVDVMITRIRRKIEPNSSRPTYLQTVRGQGYILRS